MKSLFRPLRRLRAFLVVAGLPVLLAARAAEDPLAVATRKVFEQHQNCVIWVSVVAKVSFTSGDGRPLPGNIPDREQKYEANGTILDPSGLTVAALSTIDPSKEISGREFGSGSGRFTLEANTILKEVRLVMPDGTEVPGDVVMKDADLDLAFIRPRADAPELKGVTFAPLDLTKSAEAAIADEVVTVARMDEVMNRQPAVQRGQIVALTRKPRTFLRAGGMTPGCPTFTLDGRIIGLSVNRSLKDKRPGMVLLPAADVLEIAEQAKTAKPVPTVEPPPAAEPAPKEE